MGKKRAFDSTDLAVNEGQKTNTCHRVQVSKVIRVYEELEGWKHLKEKLSFTKNTKGFMNKYEELKSKYKGTGYIIELLEIGSHKINVIEGETL